MAHSDDQGLILPPKIAPTQVVIVPIYKGDSSKEPIDKKAGEIMASLQSMGIRVKYDNSDNSRPGWKFAEHELKGVPIRIAMGLRDLENQVVELARRDTKEKTSIAMDGLTNVIANMLDDIQQNMYNKALAFREEHISLAENMEDFVKILDNKGGFISAHWDGTAETEEKIKDMTKATIRCIPLNNPLENGTCILTGKPSIQRVLFARAY
jgi:prolyl-tRNA synthetase